MKIAINAGHGKNTAGKRAPDGSMREFGFNSVVAKYLGEELLKYEGVQIKYIHDLTGNVDVALTTRTNVANNWGADLWVGLHANAHKNAFTNANGIETFVYTTPNKESVAVAEKVQAALVKVTELRNRGVKKGNLHEVRETKMPAILIEHAFMTNKKELALLKSDSFRKLCAKTEALAIADHYKLRLKKSETNENKLPDRGDTTTTKRVDLDIDGYWGELTTRALQKHFGTIEDGFISKPSLLIKAIQKKVGAEVDGYLGPETISKMQKHFGTIVDGFISKPSLMVKEMQRRLNEGKF